MPFKTTDWKKHLKALDSLRFYALKYNRLRWVDEIITEMEGRRYVL